jgi:predicted RNA-binding protein with PIN domain
MLIIVDAYNVIKQVISKKKITSIQRRSFLNLLLVYSKRKGHQIVAVFDGYCDDDSCLNTFGSIRIIYSGATQTADEYIKEYLEKCDPQNSLLVSSDNELNRVADLLGIPSIDAKHFYRFLQEKVIVQKNNLVKSTQQAIKTSAESNNALDCIMEEGSLYVSVKADLQENKLRAKQTDVLGKKNRQLLIKLKKL